MELKKSIREEFRAQKDDFISSLRNEIRGCRDANNNNNNDDNNSNKNTGRRVSYGCYKHMIGENLLKPLTVRRGGGRMLQLPGICSSLIF